MTLTVLGDERVSGESRIDCPVIRFQFFRLLPGFLHVAPASMLPSIAHRRENHFIIAPLPAP
jgi:hypothetical protein